MAIAHIHKLVRDEVVAVVRRAGCGHRQAIQIENGRDYRENRQKLWTREFQGFFFAIAK